MFANERRSKITDIIKDKGAVTTSFLVSLFGVSIETIRKDLLELEKVGALVRVHGGATAKGGVKPFYNLEARKGEFNVEKRKLSIKAAEFINEGDIIGIDEGSTAIIFAEIVKEKFRKLTVVTHCIDVANILGGCESISIILLGGRFLPSENSNVGSLTIDMLSKIRLSKCFIFPSAISMKYGICDYNDELIQVQKQMILSSEEVFILADSSKFEKKAFLKFADIDAGYTIITDSGISGEILDVYKENNIKIYTEAEK